MFATNKSMTYDMDKIKARLSQMQAGDTLNFHGGESTLMRIQDITAVCELVAAQGVRIVIQTNAAALTERHFQLFEKYQVGVGVSINGPAELNRDRLFYTEELTDRLTAKITQNIKTMAKRGLSIGIISVLSNTNCGTDEKVERLIEWALDLEYNQGLFHFRWNPLGGDHLGDDKKQLGPFRLADVWKRLADVCFDNPDRDWLPFREMVDNLYGLGGIGPCWFAPCDPYHTDAVDAVFGDGSSGNCLRTASDGVPYQRTEEKNFIRQHILSSIPMAEGGCQDCRYWRVCHGGCPDDAVDHDWRNKSRFCRTYIETYDRLEQRIRGLTPNVITVPQWKTNNEAVVFQSRMQGMPVVQADVRLDPRDTEEASTWKQSSHLRTNS